MTKRDDIPNLISYEGVVYGGLDESNHGNFPEYFSLVLSNLKKIQSKQKKLVRLYLKVI